MKLFIDLSQTEKEIMEVLWTQEKPIATPDLLTYFNENRNKNWKTQTLSTFLSRLVKKGLVKSEARGRKTIHYPTMTPEEYSNRKANSIINNMYKGSVKNFLAALYGDKKIADEDIEELRKWLSER